MDSETLELVPYGYKLLEIWLESFELLLLKGKLSLVNDDLIDFVVFFESHQ